MAAIPPTFAGLLEPLKGVLEEGSVGKLGVKHETRCGGVAMTTESWYTRNDEHEGRVGAKWAPQGVVPKHMDLVLTPSIKHGSGVLEVASGVDLKGLYPGLILGGSLSTSGAKTLKVDMTVPPIRVCHTTKATADAPPTFTVSATASLLRKVNLNAGVETKHASSGSLLGSTSVVSLSPHPTVHLAALVKDAQYKKPSVHAVFSPTPSLKAAVQSDFSKGPSIKGGLAYTIDTQHKLNATVSKVGDDIAASATLTRKWTPQVTTVVKVAGAPSHGDQVKFGVKLCMKD